MTVTVTSPCPRLFCRGRVTFDVDALTGIVSGACPKCNTLFELRHGSIYEVATTTPVGDEPEKADSHPSHR